MAAFFGHTKSPHPSVPPMGPDLAAILQGANDHYVHQAWDLSGCWLGYQHRHQELLHLQAGPRQLWVWGNIFAREKESLSPGDILLQGASNRALSQSLQKVHGTYIGLIHDEQQQLLHLFSGPRGLRPLYLLKHDGHWIWSSELKGFLAIPHFKPSVQKGAVSCFFDRGFLPGEMTWFKGVERLPASCMLTIDLKTGRGKKTSYWSWQKLQRIPDLDYRASLEEGKRRWQLALGRRIPASPKTVCISLSGGMDSRLILGGLQDQIGLRTFTFGKKRSWDVEYAQQLQRVVGHDHQWWELSTDNWWQGKEEAVWQSDGLKNLMHLHGSPFYSQMAASEVVNFNGFLGGAAAGGLLQKGAWDAQATQAAQMELRRLSTHAEWQSADWYQKDTADSWAINHRIRRFSAEGVWQWDRWIPQRLPLADDEWLDWIYQLPPTFTQNGRWFNDLAIERYPHLFKDIPWQRTGVPVGHWSNTWLLRYPIRTAQYRLGFLPNYSFANYRRWLCEKPGYSYLEALLHPAQSKYFPYLGQDLVTTLLKPHFNRQKDHTEALGRALTIELWLRAVEKYRTGK
ncbi:MAG: asparagine synthase-related protein [Bacteroidota bacterium]